MPSSDALKPGKNAVKKVIKKVNKDLPITTNTAEDELNHEINESLSLLKTQKGAMDIKAYQE